MHANFTRFGSFLDMREKLKSEAGELMCRKREIANPPPFRKTAKDRPPWLATTAADHRAGGARPLK